MERERERGREKKAQSEGEPERERRRERWRRRASRVVCRCSAEAREDSGSKKLPRVSFSALPGRKSAAGALQGLFKFRV